MSDERQSEPIEQKLTDDILNGVYQPGDRLPSERELMALFSVGRPSVREALFSLGQHGLIDAGSGRRPRVLPPSLGFAMQEFSAITKSLLNDAGLLHQLLDTRQMLEAQLAREAASAGTSNERLEHLADALRINQAQLPHPAGFQQSDTEFHQALARISGNPDMHQLLDEIARSVAAPITAFWPTAHDRMQAYRQHEAIYMAIANRDADAAEKAVQAHFHQGEYGQLNSLEGESHNFGPSQTR